MPKNINVKDMAVPQRKTTPMMEQYLEIKSNNPGFLLFYRMGDFYELFFDDALVASQALGIVLTQRGKHLDQNIPMCGVPVERAEEYLNRLIGLGHRVAVCEQVEDPAEAKKRGPKAVVQRRVKRLVTPGTITEDSLLEPRRSNILAALVRSKSANNFWIYGIATCDISTGEICVCNVEESKLSSELSRIGPNEIVLQYMLYKDTELEILLRDLNYPRSSIQIPVYNEREAEGRLCAFYGVKTLEPFGNFEIVEMLAAANLLAYIEITQRDSSPKLDFPKRLIVSDIMELDAATRANLELTMTVSGQQKGSLIDCIDLCITPAGSRLLYDRLCSPLLNLNEIHQRQAAITFYIQHEHLRENIRQALKQLPDYLRAISRLALDRGGPRDLLAIAKGVGSAKEIEAILGKTWGAEEAVLLTNLLSVIQPLLDTSILEALCESPPLKSKDGNFINRKYSDKLNNLRDMAQNARQVVAEKQAYYVELTHIKQLKIKYNNFLGYFIEVTQVHGELLLKPPFDQRFFHRQTMADAMRFSTRELGELEMQIKSASEDALTHELEIFQTLRESVLQEYKNLQNLAEILAHIDVHSALAELAVTRQWKKPTVDDSLAFIVKGGIHPIVANALIRQQEAFIPNDCCLSDENLNIVKLAIITGPNMAGKSTFLRQNALIAILAQIGSYVPVEKAHIGIIDRIFSRVGAADDLARGRSTFMVEMLETATILNHASERSFVILDEIGRGTSTFDGLSIAHASLEHLHNKNRCRTLFATHFHELTKLNATLPQLVNFTMSVDEWEGTLIFLHQVTEGCANRSYGIQVAKLAGIPPSVIKRAQKILKYLEESQRNSTPLPPLPLFENQEHLNEPKSYIHLKKTLKEIDPDRLSPREALQILYEIKELAKYL